ncbi:Mu transposase C-terminal domain-containing protein [Streptomyces lavendulae]|uniref:Mu transposase C-terminal domain-containing protein n=1 Tax=Streptomyces lavendulae TaxID=1914 RepID=UPI0032DB1CB6
MRVVSTRGVRFRRRDCVGPWMKGLAGTGVRVRFMPHHDHRIEVFDATTGRYLGPATVADEASPEQIIQVRTARAACSRRLRKDLAAAQCERYAAATRPGKPERLDAVSAVEAAAELSAADSAQSTRRWAAGCAGSGRVLGRLCRIPVWCRAVTGLPGALAC